MKKLKQILSVSLVYLLLITIAPINDSIAVATEEEIIPQCLQYEKGNLKSVIQSSEGTIISYIGEDKEKLNLSSVISGDLSLLDTIELSNSNIDVDTTFYLSQNGTNVQGTIDTTTIKSLLSHEYAINNKDIFEKLKDLENLDELELYTDELTKNEPNYNYSSGNYNYSNLEDYLNEDIFNSDVIYDSDFLNNLSDSLKDNSIKDLPETKLEFNCDNTYFNIIISGKNSKVIFYNILKQALCIITPEGYSIYPIDSLSDIIITNNYLYGYDKSNKQYKKYSLENNKVNLINEFDKNIIDITKDNYNNIWVLKNSNGKKYICKLENNALVSKYQVADFMEKIYVYDDERIIASGDEGFTIIKKIEDTILPNNNKNNAKSNNGKLPQTGAPFNTVSLSMISLISIALGSIIIKKYK
ncbi:putative secreted protein [Clostridium bornimense]|uniref:Putative secreted protein n=1 Tax=Clostridium bornimense TaxID=1216932 RepID=W6S0A4_9CLOT|nr:LPXTG cell wall anchor domain-containing protein [Clostridium bornimense]CDM70168.1 putative secreted protein [Clostridium bornimense]